MNSTSVYRSKEKGFALLTVLILMLVISAVAAGIMYSTISEQSNAGTDQQRNTAFYAAEAAMEKMTSDLGTLYTFNKAPGITQINGLTAASYYPAVTNARFQEYSITVAPQSGGSDIPASTTTTISSGSNAGLVAQIIKMRLLATAQTGQVAAGNMAGSPGEQVKMTRDIEVALIPVFQFGVFSDSDLSFFPGPQFDFNPGRIFTNGNLFLSAQSGPLTFGSKVQAVGEVVRDYLANGVQPGVGGAAARSAAVNIPTSANGCTPGGGGTGPACRALAVNEESMFQFFTRKVPNTGQAPATSSWTTVSTTTYHGNLQNGSTGVTKLTLPFVGNGVSPFEIIRRPPSGEVTTSTTSSSRLFNQAQIRILLDDNPANLPGGQRGTDVNLANYSGTVSGVGTPQFMAQGIQLPSLPLGCGPHGTACVTLQSDPSWVNPSPGTLTPWPLISGWLRVEYRDTTGAYNDITQEWLNLGFARQSQESVGPTPFSVPNAEKGVANTIHPNAILLFQYPIPSGIFTITAPQYKWYPINMYDPREGEVRDTATAGCAVAGVMNIIELDMDNLRKWLNGSLPGSGANVESSSQNGYIVYYSDRRGMQLDPGSGPNPPATELNGEYGFEDVINIQNANGVPNGALDVGEDVNGNGVVDTYGVATMGNGFGLPGANTNPYTGTGRIANCQTTGRANRVTGPRHAIRAVNGSLGHLPLKPDGTGGTTIASENPVYVQGNYNANAASGGFGTAAGGVNEAAAAVIADAVTLLSVNYTDLRSLTNPTALGNRPAGTSWYRLAVAGGKNINFTAPQVLGSWTASDDFGTDGGVHNFLRYVEGWGGQTSHYLGSLVSFYYSRQAVGVFKCCTVVYGAPQRDYAFDQNFLDPAKLPPGTPRFQDIDNLGYHQDFTPQ